MPPREFNQGERRAHEAAPPLPTLLLMPLLLLLLLFLWREEQAGEMRNISCESNFYPPQIPEAREEEREEEREDKEEEEEEYKGRSVCG